MLQRIQIQTRDGIREYPFVSSAAALKAAADSGEITVGQELIYREYIVLVLEDYELLILDTVRNIVPFPPMDSDASFQFTAGPAQFMNGRPFV